MGEYIGCWVLVPLDWRQGDPVPTYAKGGCGECRGRGKGSRPKEKGGCSLNHASAYGPCHQRQKVKKSRRVDSPGPVRRQQQRSGRSHPYARRSSPEDDLRSDYLAHTRDLFESCLGNRDDLNAHQDLRRAVSKLKQQGWAEEVEKETWYGRMCAYLDARFQAGQM